MQSEARPSFAARFHLVSASLCILLWGASFAVTRSAVREVPPMTLALVRFALASLILWPVSRCLHGRIRLAREDRWAALGLALCGVTLYHAFENLGLRHTSASTGSLIIATVPLATAVAEAARTRSLPGRSTVAGLCAAFVGVVVLTSGSGGAGTSFIGIALLGGAVACWVGYTGLVKRLAGRYPDVWLASLIAGLGALGLTPLAAGEWLREPLRLPSPAAWAALLYLGALCSALAYVLWNAAVRVLGTVPTSSLIYGMPLAGVLSGALLLGEPLSEAALGGGALIVGGVAVASGAFARPERKGARAQGTSPVQRAAPVGELEPQRPNCERNERGLEGAWATGALSGGSRPPNPSDYLSKRSPPPLLAPP